MRNGRKSEWENLIVDPAQVMKKLEPGMSIFLDYGVYHLTIPLDAEQTAIKPE